MKIVGQMQWRSLTKNVSKDRQKSEEDSERNSANWSDVRHQQFLDPLCARVRATMIETMFTIFSHVIFLVRCVCRQHRFQVDYDWADAKDSDELRGSNYSGISLWTVDTQRKQKKPKQTPKNKLIGEFTRTRDDTSTNIMAIQLNEIPFRLNISPSIVFFRLCDRKFTGNRSYLEATTSDRRTNKTMKTKSK